MPLRREGLAGSARRGRNVADAFLVWNRRIHYFLGLYLLFFTWLFVLTGLLLNHPRWEVAQFWSRRVQSTTEHHIRPLAGASDVDRARDLMRQVDITGEMQWPPAQPVNGPLTFQVNRPGLTIDVKADLLAGRATLQRTRLNAWGVAHILHTFTGMPAADPRHTRDWMLTTVWAFSMDGVAAGLIVMVLSSYIMWFRLKAKRRGGVVALLSGVGTCATFITGLEWWL